MAEDQNNTPPHQTLTGCLIWLLCLAVLFGLPVFCSGLYQRLDAQQEMGARHIQVLEDRNAIERERLSTERQKLAALRDIRSEAADQAHLTGKRLFVDEQSLKILIERLAIETSRNDRERTVWGER